MPCTICGKGLKLSEGEIFFYENPEGYGKLVERTCEECTKWLEEINVSIHGRTDGKSSDQGRGQDPWYRAIMERFRTLI